MPLRDFVEAVAKIVEHDRLASQGLSHLQLWLRSHGMAPPIISSKRAHRTTETLPADTQRPPARQYQNAQYLFAPLNDEYSPAISDPVYATRPRENRSYLISSAEWYAYSSTDLSVLYSTIDCCHLPRLDEPEYFLATPPSLEATPSDGRKLGSRQNE